jgi:hypothetical protein
MSCANPAARVQFARYVNAAAPVIAPVLVVLLDQASTSGTAWALATFVRDHATELASPLSAQLENRSPWSARVILRSLGRAGAGHEAAVGGQLTHPDASVRREAWQALVQIGTELSANIVTEQLLEGDPVHRKAALDVLLRFPAGLIRAQLRRILRQDDFVAQNPKVVLHLLGSTDPDSTEELAPELRHLVRLGRKFWRPALVRVASAARQLLAS